MSSARAATREPRRGRRAVWLAVTLAVLLVGAFTARHVTAKHDSRSDIRHAAAAHWHVSDKQVTAERFTTHDRCAVAEVSVNSGEATKTSVIATEMKNSSSVVTRERREHFFATDDSN